MFTRSASGRPATRVPAVVSGLLLALGLLLIATPVLGQPQPADNAHAADNHNARPAGNERPVNPGANSNIPATNNAAPGDTPVERRLREVAGMFRDDPGGYEAIFSPEFLSAVPPDRLTSIFARYRSDVGAVVDIRVVDRSSPHKVEADLVTDQRKKFPLRLGVAPTEPHLVTYLWVGAPAAQFGSLQEALAGLKQLPGKVSFAAWQLGTPEDPSAIVELGALNADLALPLGSAFKLYILGTLVDDVNAGRRRVSNTFALRDEWKSWPSGVLHSWPAGAEVTLHTLATQMISISDNTATDHLLFILGRERVEAHQAAMGHAAPQRNRPFLATREMFRLKEVGHARRLTEYLALDPAGRRDYLRKLATATADRATFAGIDTAKPTAVDSVEWFGSAADMCRAMHWLRDHTAAGRGAAPLREVLAVNPGIGSLTNLYRWVGFKGGSEPGVLNLTYLLQRTDGQWIAVSVSWMNPDGPVQDAELTSRLQGILAITAK